MDRHRHTSSVRARRDVIEAYVAPGQGHDDIDGTVASAGSNSSSPTAKSWLRATSPTGLLQMSTKPGTRNDDGIQRVR